MRQNVYSKNNKQNTSNSPSVRLMFTLCPTSTSMAAGGGGILLDSNIGAASLFSGCAQCTALPRNVQSVDEKSTLDALSARGRGDWVLLCGDNCHGAQSETPHVWLWRCEGGWEPRWADSMRLLFLAEALGSKHSWGTLGTAD